MDSNDKALTHAAPGALEQAQPRSMLEMVMRAAADPSIDPGRLKEFLQIGRELELDKKKHEWAVAFKNAKEDLDGVRLTKRGKIVYEGKQGKQDSVIKFLRYDDIAEAVKPTLKTHGLAASYTFRYENSPAKTICVMTLTHTNGYERQFESVPLPMVDSGGGKNDVQGAGSVMTYGRRYAVCAAFDIVAENEDDDGNMGRDQPQPITEEELVRIQDIVQECENRNQGFRALFTKWLVKEIKVDNIKDVRQGSQLKSVMTKLNEKQRALGMK